MNAKKVKAIRQALRLRGIDPAQREYQTRPVLKQTSHLSRIRYAWRANDEGKEFFNGQRGTWVKATHSLQTRLVLTSGRKFYQNTKEISRVLQAA
jgi:hypothetical protein